MTPTTLQSPSVDPHQTIRLLQQELAETNREVLALTLELEKRVEERTAALSAAQEELRRKNADLERRTVQLEAVNKDLESFSYSVSHDLRAPLRHMDAFIRIVTDEERAKLSPSARQAIDRISTSVKRMSQLIEDLLAFARNSHAELHQTRVDMSELVQETLRELSTETQGRNIEWEIQPLPVVHGDRTLLAQVWQNLLGNAVKYTRPRNPARIRIGGEIKDGECHFQVQDNGVGFDMSYVGKLFGVFQRLHSPTEFEGTGIGLATVRAIIGRHGGRTWAVGKPGEGATIGFTLPGVDS
jgi:light-regulated signal transduction histidine kinase (bacteriophytochrome)